MRLIFFGSAGFGIPSLQALAAKACGDELVHIITQPARPAGRQMKPKTTPVALWAKENSVPFTETDNINSSEILEQIAACRGDLLVVIAFGQKIGNEVINLHPKGAINVHASLLPKYRGAAPINRAVINGDSQTGISIITLAEKMDAGRILATAKIPIADDDTAGTVHDKLAQLAGPVLLETIAQIGAGTAEYRPQNESAVTFAGKLKKSDGFIDWDDSADSIRCRIHGLWPWPGAQVDYLSRKTGKSCRVTIAKARVVTGSDKQQSDWGVLDKNLNVICGKDRLKILQIKPAGKNLMDFKAFVNGRNTARGDVFIPIHEN